MKRKLLTITLSILLILMGLTRPEAAAPPQEGNILPDFTLPVPGERADRTYLGLSGWGKSFKVPEIKTRVVLIQIFSMYCPFCQKEAPAVNQLHAAIENAAALKGKIKIIGIGSGNSAYEVDVFKKRYNIPFPLFPDGDYTLHKLLGEVRTPYFIAVKINSDGTHEVIYSRLGSLGNINEFLNLICKSAGI
jgi:thiol-disulfide isomerase/thioredoxin